MRQLCAVIQSRRRPGGGESNFLDFPVLRMKETPPIETHIIPSGERPFGVGEATVCPVIPATINAIHAATGKRIRRWPVSAKDLL